MPFSLPFNAKDIILGLTEHSSAQDAINNVLIILKYYIYVCRCKCRDPDLEGGLEFLKYAINIEKASMIYLSPVLYYIHDSKNIMFQCTKVTM
jgi:hypothetical protein